MVRIELAFYFGLIPSSTSQQIEAIRHHNCFHRATAKLKHHHSDYSLDQLAPEPDVDITIVHACA